MLEVWKSLPGYEDLYEVSNFGRIKSLRYNHTKEAKILSTYVNQNGYMCVKICRQGIKQCLVHRLVAMLFVPNTDNKPHINHKDGNKANNTSDNLEWCTRSENQLHACRVLGKGILEMNGASKLTHVKAKEMRELFQREKLSYRRLGALFGVSDTLARSVILNKSWRDVTC